MSVIGLLCALGCAPEEVPPDPQADPPPAPAAVPATEPGPAPAPAAEPRGDLPDFTAISDVPTLKRTFYRYLHPLIVSENDRIRHRRRRLLALRHEGSQDRLSAADRTWLTQLSAEYDLPPDEAHTDAELLDRLERRVDVVPPELALAQAAIESAWGRSRFARLGNNIYGEWCFTPGCGIVPGDRDEGSSHEIADFGSPAGSVRSYSRNLNTHYAYADFRRRRQQQRAAGDSLDAHALAATLEGYSTLREEYVHRVRTVMRQNRALVPGVITPQRSP